MSSSTFISTTGKWLRKRNRRVRAGRVPGAATAVPAGSARSFLRRWLAAGTLLAAALLVVLYVANAIVVNDLLTDVTSLERECDMVRNENEKLRADLLKLMAVERVTTLASQRLGMVQPTQPPIALNRPDAPATKKNDREGEER
jgi:hypothetical protein